MQPLAYVTTDGIWKERKTLAKCRLTQRSGRIGSASHNDRSFLRGRDAREVAPHIDTDRSGDNLAISWQASAETFEEAELNYYRSHYAAACEATNERYIREGHPERCKTPDDLYRGRLTRPEELILQIGDMNSGIDPEVFRACVSDYKKAFELWNKEHGRHGHLITLALHYDEASPHAHIRRVWDYTDKDGNIRLGQNKALEAAGVELPDPEKKADRYNNRKMTFDAMMREKWIEICKSHGIEVETEPRVNMRHKEKAEYVAERLQQDIDAKTQRVKYVEADLVSALEQLEALEGKILEKEQITSLKVKKSVFGANKASIEGTEEELLGLYATAARVEEAEKAAKDAQSILDEKDRILEDAQRKAEEIMESANSFDAVARMARLESKVKKYEKVFAQYPELRQVMEKIAEKEH